MKTSVCIGCLLLVSTAGCGTKDEDVVRRDPIYDAPPVPQDVIDRVLAEPDEVPHREDATGPAGLVFGDLGERLGAALQDAADTPSKTPPRTSPVRVILFTANWCTWCRPAQEKAVPWLTSLGYAVEILDVTRPNSSALKLTMPRSLPAWTFLRDGLEVYRQEGGYLPEHLQKAVNAVPLAKPPAVNAAFGPTVRVADLLPLVAGASLKLGTAATVVVPRDLKWTVSQKPGVVVLSFDPAPQVTVHKILNWRVRLEGVEITPTAVTLQIDNLPDVTVKLDWNFPGRSSGVDISESHDLHRAAASVRPRRERPVLRFLGRSVLFAYRVCSIASFVLLVV